MYTLLAYLVKNNLNYISPKDFDIHKKNELESTFIEILTSSGKNIVGRTCYTDTQGRYKIPTTRA